MADLNEFQILEDVARSERFELPTFWFVARRSIQLSYERVIRRDSDGGAQIIGNLVGMGSGMLG